MRRALLIAALALLAFPAAAGAASVKLVECVPALEPARAQRHVRGAHAPRARQRAHAGPLHAAGRRQGALPGWRRVAASGLDEWLTSYPDVRRFSYSKTVRNLSAPASYRMRRALPLARRRR